MKKTKLTASIPYAVLVLALILFYSCCSVSDEFKPLTVSIYGIGFECRHLQRTQDTLCLKPIIMHLDVNISNNTDNEVMLGSYYNRFDEDTRKYGRFELIYNHDTVGLYSNNSVLSKLKSRQTIDLQLYYEGNTLFGADKFLDMMSIGWVESEHSGKLDSDQIKSIQQIIDSLKIGYISFNNSRIESVDIHTEISPEIFVDYIYNDNQGVEMRKNDSCWYSYYVTTQD